MANYTINFKGDILEVYKVIKQLQKDNSNIAIKPTGTETMKAFRQLDKITATKKTANTPPIKRARTTSPGITRLGEINYGWWQNYKTEFQPPLIKYKHDNGTNADNSTHYKGYLYCDTANIERARQLIATFQQRHPKFTINRL
jgi:hypothetical protein